MPIYMDRHDVSESVTAENVAQLHQQDLKIQHKYSCRGLTYWFDEVRKTAFCLIEAPTADCIKEMHDNAHGEVPHQIIEVEPQIVESFLGRIEDPKKSKDTELNIINDPAFRIIMVTRLNRLSLKDDMIPKLEKLHEEIQESLNPVLEKYSGRLVKQADDMFLASFKSVSCSVKCALEISEIINKAHGKYGNELIELKISLSDGVPVTNKQNIFEDAIQLAERMSNISNAQVILTTEVKELYKSENMNKFIDCDNLYVLSHAEEQFLNSFMDYTESHWTNTDLSVDDFGSNLGFSKSQLYRKLTSLTGKSPNTFIKDYRLTRALYLLNKQKGNISEIAFETGFGSLSYFSKCFQKKYGTIPSDYVRARL